MAEDSSRGRLLMMACANSNVLAAILMSIYEL